MKTEAEKTGPAEGEGNRRRIARLESLRRWMLVLAALLLIGGYAIDILPVLYTSAIPLIVALLATYRIKRLEEGAGKQPRP